MWSRHYIGLYAHALASGLLSGSITSASSYCTYVYNGSRTYTLSVSVNRSSRCIVYIPVLSVNRSNGCIVQTHSLFL
jgi:hypothetical protein